MPLDTARGDVQDMFDTWRKCRDVIAGEKAVKLQGVRYLPKIDPGQKDATYQMYLKRASFYNGTARTRDALLGMTFHRDAVFNIPGQMEDQLHDITCSGVPANDFAASVLDEVICVGRAGILIDMQTDPVEQSERRPYWVLYKAEDIINWRIARVGGKYITTLVILHETEEAADPKDPYIQQCIDQWRVLELKNGAYVVTVFRKEKKDGKDDFVVYEGPMIPLRRGEPLAAIPFVPLNALTATWDLVKPPMLDLVEVNLSHYLTSADHEWGAHMVGIPTPWGVGFPKAWENKPIPLGPGAVWQLNGPHAQAGMLEFKGEGLGALEKLMDRKEGQMAVLGSRILEQIPQEAETAEAVRARNSASHASLRTMVNTVSAALTRALNIHAFWIGLDVKSGDVSVELNKEFFELTLAPDDIRAEVLRWQSGGSSFQTFYALMERAGRTTPGVTVEEELALIKSEETVRMQKDLQKQKSMLALQPKPPVAKPPVAGVKPGGLK